MAEVKQSEIVKLQKVISKYTVSDVLSRDINTSIQWITQKAQSNLKSINDSIQSKFRDDIFALSIEKRVVYHIFYRFSKDRHTEMKALDCYLEISDRYKEYTIIQIELVLHPSLCNLVHDIKRGASYGIQKVNMWELPEVDPIRQSKLLPLTILSCYPLKPREVFGNIFRQTKDLTIAEKKETWRIARDILENTERMINHL